MKRINWVAVTPNKIHKDSFWAKCEEGRMASDDIFADLFSKFSTEATKVKNLTEKPVSTAPISGGLRVINKDTAQSILILLNTLLKNVPYEQLKRDLLLVNMTALKLDTVDRIIEYIPPPEQMQRLQKLKKSGEQLMEAETFLATIGEIDGLLPRLQSISFKISFPESFQYLKHFILNSTAAGEEVRTNKKFSQILELILLVGNYMNSGLKLNRAFGYDIPFLTKITDVKDSQNRRTLMNYLVDTIERKFPDLLHFYDELSHVDRAAGVSLEFMRDNIQQMKLTCEDLNYELENRKDPQSPDDNFFMVMRVFGLRCTDQIKLLTKITNDLEKYYKEMAEYFVFEVKEYPMDKFFNDIKIFKYFFMQAVSEKSKQRGNAKKNQKQ